MRRWFGVVCACAACDSVAGLRGTAAADARPIDAAFFDAPADAPYACPPPGRNMSPTYSPQFQEVIATGDCRFYSFSKSANRAAARCTQSIEAVTLIVEQGTYQPPTLAQVFPSPVPPNGKSLGISVKLSPEGDELWVIQLDTTSLVYTASVYVPTATSWTYDHDVTTIAANASDISAPTAKGSGRRFLYYIAPIVHEVVEGPPGTWTDVNQYTAASLGVAAIDDVPSMTPDGLRMVFSASFHAGPSQYAAIAYADRASTSVPFSPATPLVGIPGAATTPFLADDCGRIYFSGLGAILFVAQSGWQ
jgi:hypothetical protein